MSVCPIVGPGAQSLSWLMACPESSAPIISPCGASYGFSAVLGGKKKNGRTSLCTSSPIPVQHHCNRNPQLQHPAEGGKLLLLRIACSKASQLLLPTRKQHLCLLETNKLFQLA